MKRKIFSLELLLIPIVGALLLFLACFIGSFRFITETFFLSFGDFFMDFFNSTRDAAKFNVYTEYKVIYPALVNLFFMFCSFFVRDEALDHSVNRYIMQKEIVPYIEYGIYLLICLFLLYIAIQNLLKNQTRAQKIFTYCLVVFSFPFLFTVERGNTLLLTAIMVMLFYAFYDDEKKYKRELSIVCLALAASIKLYPVLFVLVLFKKKDWRNLTKFGVYTTLLLFLPFIFYGGLEGLYLMIHQSFSHFGVQLQYFSNLFLVLYYGFGVSLTVSKMINYFVIILLIINFFIVKKSYQEYTALAIILMCISPGTEPYTLIYFLISVVLLLKEKEKGYLEIVYMGILLLLITYNPITWSLNLLTIVFMVAFYIIHFVVIPMPYLIKRFKERGTFAENE